MTTLHEHRSLGRTLALAVLAGCASARGAAPDLPPYVLSVDASADSAMRLFRAALEAERLAVDGTPGADVLSMTSTFKVRQGGMGEAEVVIAGRARNEASDAASPPAASPPASPPAARLTVDATVRDVGRMITLTPEQARSPNVLQRSAHAINPNDREVLGVLSRLLERLTKYGARKAATTGGAAGPGPAGRP